MQCHFYFYTDEEETKCFDEELTAKQEELYVVSFAWENASFLIESQS